VKQRRKVMPMLWTNKKFSYGTQEKGQKDKKSMINRNTFPVISDRLSDSERHIQCTEKSIT
jgi:hypothetical protein